MSKSNNVGTGSKNPQPSRQRKGPQRDRVSTDRQCPTGGKNESNNISQTQMTPPRPTRGGDQDK